ncbi:MAG: extracellular solute-binding protein [Propionibacteriales bacterium]|nr:extracellular solute-binding protein [Propionibacteriales bacterium]
MKDLRKLQPAVALAGAVLLASACGAEEPDRAVSADAPFSEVEQITNYSDADREQYLFDCAKTEGSVTLYTSSSVAEDLLAPAFEEKYQGVEMEVNTATNQLVQQIIEEEEADVHNFDVYGDIYGNIVRDSTYFARYSSPNTEAVLDDLVTPYSVSANGFIMGAAYNPDLVTGDDIPTSYEDLADPKWEGKIAGGYDTSTPVTYAVARATLGDEFMEEFSNNVAVTEGVSSRGVADLMEAGTFPIAWSVSASYHQNDFLAQGLPFRFVSLDPMVGFYSDFSISAHAPHPCAATLLVDWMIDTQPGGGQEVWHEYGALSPLKDGPRLYFEIEGTDQSTWNVIPSSEPSIVEGFDDYPEAAAAHLEDFRNQFIRN